MDAFSPVLIWKGEAQSPAWMGSLVEERGLGWVSALLAEKRGMSQPLPQKETEGPPAVRAELIKAKGWGRSQGGLQCGLQSVTCILLYPSDGSGYPLQGTHIPRVVIHSPCLIQGPRQADWTGRCLSGTITWTFEEYFIVGVGPSHPHDLIAWTSLGEVQGRGHGAHCSGEGLEISSGSQLSHRKGPGDPQ